MTDLEQVEQQKQLTNNTQDLSKHIDGGYQDNPEGFTDTNSPTFITPIEEAPPLEPPGSVVTTTTGETQVMEGGGGSGDVFSNSSTTPSIDVTAATLFGSNGSIYFGSYDSGSTPGNQVSTSVEDSEGTEEQEVVTVGDPPSDPPGEPPTDPPTEPPGEPPVSGGRNPGNDKEVGNSPFDGETGASGKPGKGKPMDGIDVDENQPPGFFKHDPFYDEPQDVDQFSLGYDYTDIPDYSDLGYVDDGFSGLDF